MSDLVERVARAMCADAGFDPFDAMANDGPRWRYYEPPARAAIKAVAEWLGEDPLAEQCVVASGVLLSELEGSE